jgi:hypothetical protein
LVLDLFTCRSICCRILTMYRIQFMCLQDALANAPQP